MTSVSCISAYWNRFEPVLLAAEQIANGLHSDSSALNSAAPVFYVNPFTLDIHQEHTFYGASWKYIYMFLQVLTGVSRGRLEMNDALAMMKDSWPEISLAIKDAVSGYKKALEEAPGNVDVQSYTILSICEECAFFHDFLMKDRLHNGISKMQKVYVDTFGEDFFLLDDILLLQQLGAQYAVCSFEGIVQHAMPVRILQKLQAMQSLDANEEEDLYDWINAIESSPTFITSLLLHRTLKACLIQNQIGDQVGDIEMALIERGLNRLQEPDIIWDSYLFQIYPGTKVIEGVVLGEKRANEALMASGLSLYDLKDAPGQFVLVSKNPSALSRYQAACENSWGLPAISLKNCTKSGCIAVTDKIVCGLHSIEWTANAQYIEESQEKLVAQLSDFVKLFVQEGKMPSGLTPRKLAVTEDNSVVSLLPTVKSESIDFDYAVLEDFVQQIARNNIYIFQRIITQSGLREQQVAKALREEMAQVILQQSCVESSPMQSGSSNSLVYCQIVSDRFDAVRSQIRQSRWDELKAMIQNDCIDLLDTFGVAATKWPEAIADMLKHKVHGKLSQFLEQTTPVVQKTTFPEWFDF